MKILTCSLVSVLLCLLVCSGLHRNAPKTSVASATSKILLAGLIHSTEALDPMSRIQYSFEKVFDQAPNCCDFKGISALCPRCYGDCVLRSNARDKLQELLDKKYVGQDIVKPQLINMIENHIACANDPSCHHSATSFLIGGENGVGKSYLLQLLGEAIYQYPENSGFLVLSGGNYKGSSKQEVAKHQESIFNLIVKQLERCPQSLVVIDDVHYVHASTLTVVQQFMDSGEFVVTDTGKKVQKNKCMIGFVSDFGRGDNFGSSEGLTAGMSYEELENAVLEHARTLWKYDPKQIQLIKYVFPFLSLTNSEIERIITLDIRTKASLHFKGRISKVECSEASLQFMRHNMQKKFPSENARGVDKYVNSAVLPQLKTALLANAEYKDGESVQVKVEFSKGSLVFYFTTAKPEL